MCCITQCHLKFVHLLFVLLVCLGCVCTIVWCCSYPAHCDPMFSSFSVWFLCCWYFHPSSLADTQPLRKEFITIPFGKEERKYHCSYIYFRKNSLKIMKLLCLTKNKQTITYEQDFWEVNASTVCRNSRNYQICMK